MSQENVEIVGGGYQHFAATGDFRVEVMDPDFVWDMSTFRGWPEQQTYNGLEGARKFIADWTEWWEDWELEVVELIDAGENRVLAILHQRGRSKTTGSRWRWTSHSCGPSVTASRWGCRCTRIPSGAARPRDSTVSGGSAG